MKRILTLVALTAFAFTSVNAQKISGEGSVVKKEIDVDGFTGVSLGFAGDVYLTQGSSYNVVVEAQQNIIDNLKREVRNGVWYVKHDKNVKNSKGVKVYITMPTLDYASVAGSGNLITETKFTGLGNLKATVSGSGNLKLDVEASDVTGGISGSGKIVLKGTGSSLDMSISGSGDIYAEDLKVEDCDVAISGSSNAKVWVTGDLDASISGSGDIRYKGDAPKVRARVSGSGDVREMTDGRQ